MSLLIVAKDPKTGGCYAIANSVYKTSYGLTPYQGLSRLDLQRFNNFVFGNTVYPSFVRKLYEKIGFQNFPKELTTGFLVQEFVSAAIEIGVDNDDLSLDDNGALKKENFQFFFIQKDRAFDVGLGKVHEVVPGHFYVGSSFPYDSNVFYAVEIEYKKTGDVKKALLNGFKALHECISEVGYPCYLYDSLQDKFFRIEEDGQEIEVEMPIYWGK